MEPSTEKISRQARSIPKTDFHFWIEDGSYDWLCAKASEYGVSVAKVLNAILKGKPEPDEFYLR